MAQVILYGFEIVPGPEGSDGKAVPLWHNKDISEIFAVAAFSGSPA